MSNTYDANQLSCMYKSGSNKISYIEALRDNKTVEDDARYKSRNAFYASQSPKRAGYRTYYRKKRKQLNCEFDDEQH